MGKIGDSQTNVQLLVAAGALLLLLAIKWVIGWLWSSGPVFIPVRGVVQMDGQPLPDAAVMFQAVKGGPIACGVTNSAGKYELLTSNHAGAMPGEYQVAIARVRVSYHAPPMLKHPEANMARDTYAVEEMESMGGIMKMEWLIPRKFGIPGQSGITTTVAKGKPSYDFALSSTGQ